MAKEKSYRELQDDAELLGIAQNQSTEKLQAAIAEVTSVNAVSTLMELNAKLGEAAEAVTEGTGTPVDLNKILEPVTELLDAQLEDKNVYTDPYRTGLANGLSMAIGAVKNEDVNEHLLKPVTQTAIKGAAVITGRQRLIKAAGKFVTLASGTGRLRSGLTPDDIKQADEIMKAVLVASSASSAGILICGRPTSFVASNPPIMAFSVLSYLARAFLASGLAIMSG